MNSKTYLENMTTVTPIEIKEARGIRGRFGVDVWKNYVNAGREAQIRFLTSYGIREDRIQGTRTALYAILFDEGIKQS